MQTREYKWSLLILLTKAVYAKTLPEKLKYLRNTFIPVRRFFPSKTSIVLFNFALNKKNEEKFKDRMQELKYCSHRYCHSIICALPKFGLYFQ
jgi:hypothetical protein